MAYWYENKALYQSERDAYRQFGEEYKAPLYKVQFTYDEKRRFVVLIDMTFRITKEAMMEIAKDLPNGLSERAVPCIRVLEEQPWRCFKFCIVYEHDFPGRDSSGMFGGSIKVFPMTSLKPGFHHLLTDTASGLRYICQVGSVKSSAVNGYTVMKRILRFLTVYSFWEKTGIDIDKEGEGKWNKNSYI